MEETKLLEKINYEYGVFYDLINGLVLPAMRDYQDRFKDYQDNLYDFVSTDSVADAELKVSNLLHLVDELRYDAERLPANNP